MIRIKKNILTTFKRPILLLIIFAPILYFGSQILIETFQDKNEDLSLSFYVTLIGFAFILLLIIFEFYKQLKIVPNVSISKTQLNINSEKFLIENIKDLKLTGKFFYRNDYRFRSKELIFREGLEIVMNNGRTIHLFDEFYKNIARLK